MSSAGQRNKIISYSHSLYNKHSQQELSLHTKGSISPDHKLSIGEETYNTLIEFNTAFIDIQRELLSTKARNIVRAHVVAIVKLDTQKEILNYILPSLDGILFGKHRLAILEFCVFLESCAVFTHCVIFCSIFMIFYFISELL